MPKQSAQLRPLQDSVMGKGGQHWRGASKDRPGKGQGHNQGARQHSAMMSWGGCLLTHKGQRLTLRWVGQGGKFGWYVCHPQLWRGSGNCQQLLRGVQQSSDPGLLSFLFPQEKGPQRARPASCKRSSVSYTHRDLAFPSIG